MLFTPTVIDVVDPRSAGVCASVRAGLVGARNGRDGGVVGTSWQAATRVRQAIRVHPWIRIGRQLGLVWSNTTLDRKNPIELSSARMYLRLPRADTPIS